MILFFAFVCHFYINKFVIGVLDMTEIRDARSWDRSLECATKISEPSS